jgi:hypothetical protein
MTYFENLIEDIADDTYNPGAANPYTMSDAQALYILNNYSTHDYSITASTLSMNSVKNEIDNYNPIYTRWTNAANTSSHALVIQGYNTEVTNNIIHHRISFMDCNLDNYVTLSYATGYLSGDKIYYWQSSIK